MTQRRTPSPPKKNGQSGQTEPGDGDQSEGRMNVRRLMEGWGCASSSELEKGNPDKKPTPKDVLFKIMEQKEISVPEPGGTLTADDWHGVQLAIGDLIKRKVSPAKYLEMSAASVLEVLNQPARKKTTKKVTP